MTTGDEMPWIDACKSAIAAMVKNTPDQPTMAYLDLAMVAKLRNESEEQALAWLKANPERCEDHGGMWLVRGP